MLKADVCLEIIFTNVTKKIVIRTNAKKDAVKEILETWLLCQRGKGKDGSEPNNQKIYTVKIQLDLSNDRFYTESDTGNKGLTCEIIIATLEEFKKIKFQPLSE